MFCEHIRVRVGIVMCPARLTNYAHIGSSVRVEVYKFFCYAFNRWRCYKSRRTSCKRRCVSVRTTSKLGYGAHKLRQLKFEIIGHRNDLIAWRFSVSSVHKRLNPVTFLIWECMAAFREVPETPKENRGKLRSTKKS